MLPPFLSSKNAQKFGFSDVIVGIGEVIVGYRSLMTPWIERWSWGDRWREWRGGYKT